MSWRTPGATRRDLRCTYASALAQGSGGTFEHIVPLAGPAEIVRSVQLAHETFLGWRDVRLAERRRLLLRLADLIERNADEFVRRAALDNGMAVTSAAGLAATAGSPTAEHFSPNLPWRPRGKQ